MAAPELTYGGFPLANDVDQGVGSFLDKNLNTEDLRDLAPSIARVGSQADGLAWPNYPAPPKIRPNQLYWPTGASRWALGYFFADDTSKDKIVEAAHSSSNVALKLRVVQNETFTANLFLLTPRRISDVPDGNNVWLLPLVDERYFWQFNDIGDFTVTTSSTWAGMFSQLGSQLGVTISADSVAAAYLIPDPTQLTRQGGNAGVLLDAVAHSVGQRIVRHPDGTVHSMNWTSSQSQLTTNIESKTPWQQIAGGELEYGPVPASVNVFYRKFVDHVPIPNKVAKNTVNATSSSTTTGAVKTFHSSLYSDHTTNGTGSGADNSAALSALAAAVASDYYASLANAYDRTFAGIKDWETSGYDDHVLYQFGGEYPVPELSATTTVAGKRAATRINKSYEKWAHTRVQSIPVNFGAENQLSQDSSLVPLKSHQFGALDEELDGDNPATFSIWENDDPGSRIETNHTEGSNDIEVYKFADQVIPADVKSHAFFDFESEKWYIHPRNALFSGTVQAKAFGPLSAAWSPLSGDGAVLGLAGYDVCFVKKDGAGDEIEVRLRHVGTPGSGGGRLGPAPNLKSGNILSFKYDESGAAICVSGYLDSPLGVIIMWEGTVLTIPWGWAEQLTMAGRLPVGVDSSQTSEPDLNVHGTTEVGDSGSTPGNFQHDHPDPTHTTSDHGIAGHTISAHTDSGAPAPGLDHDSQSHSGGAAPGLAHEDQTHDDLVHAWGSGVVNDDNDPNTNTRLQDHEIADHVMSDSGQDHTITDHNNTKHTIANHAGLTHSGSGSPGLGHDTGNHVIAAINHYPPMWTVRFIKRIWE